MPRRVHTMGARGAVLGATAALCVALLAAPPEMPGGPATATAGERSPTCRGVPVYPWQGEIAERRVVLRRAVDRRLLRGLILRPADHRAFPGARPAVVFMHGRGRNRCDLYWAARTLAGQGYIALTISAGDGMTVEALRGGLSFLRSRRNPWRRITAAGRIGAAGFSQGAATVARAQEDDRRIRAIVAFDSLRAHVLGDRGAAHDCTGPRRGLMRPRVPAMGQAMGLPCFNRWRDRRRDLKKTGFARWVRSRVPSAVVVFASSHHRDFGGQLDRGSRVARNRLYFGHYMTAWFDRWLQPRGADRRDAARRLLTSRVDDVATGRVLSSHFRSGIAMPGVPRRCALDLRACVHRGTAGTASVSSETVNRAAQAFGWASFLVALLLLLPLRRRRAVRRPAARPAGSTRDRSR